MNFVALQGLQNAAKHAAGVTLVLFALNACFFPGPADEIEEVAQPERKIEPLGSNEAVGILNRYGVFGDTATNKMIVCLGRELEKAEPPVTVIAPYVIAEIVSHPGVLADAVVRERLKQIGVRYMILLHGSAVNWENAGFFGADKSSRASAEIFDVKRDENAGAIEMRVSGQRIMVPFLLFMIDPDTQEAACTHMAEQLHGILTVQEAGPE